MNTLALTLVGLMAGMPLDVASDTEEDGVYGAWVIPEMEGDEGVSYSFTLVVADGSLLVVQSCRFDDGTELYALPTALAEITGNEIHVLTSGYAGQSLGDSRCESDFEPGSLQYWVAGDSLFLGVEGIFVRLYRLGSEEAAMGTGEGFSLRDLPLFH